MNDTAASAPGSSLTPDWTGVFTATHLVLVAALMVLVIVAIIFGARLAHRRKQGRREIEEHNAQVIEAQQATDPAPAAAPAPAPAAAPASSVPAAPAPPAPPRPALHAVATPAEPATTPIAPVPPMPAPVPATEPAGAAAADGPVSQLKGLGPKVAARLAEFGITTVGQVAALTDDQATALDAQLGPFTGRMARDRWQEQARFLAAGDRAGFEAVFGRL